MCGIAGIVGTSDPSRVEKINSMIHALTHRGPDDFGSVLFDNAVIGHTRLSVVDLNFGHQPMSTADGRYWITFNGEIYNYKDLRNDLKAKGSQFQTASDTEVLLAMFQMHGIEGLYQLNGMFSFAIWDVQMRMLFAARDRLGKKPFYYSILSDRALVFASEIKAILQSNLVQGHLNLSAMDAYLALGYVPPNGTAFTQIKNLAPAHYLIWHNGDLKVEQYWQPQFKERKSMDEGDAVEELKYLLKKAVDDRMAADVPVGAFLSGGLDSSTVVALMQRQSSRPVKTFSVGFGGLMNELPYAKAVAEQELTDHHEIEMDIPVGELLCQMADIYDEPLGDSSNIPTYLICKFARDQVKVILTGDGGDEMFGGYDWYQSLVQSETISKSMITYSALRIIKFLTAIGNSMGLSHEESFQKICKLCMVAEMTRSYPDIADRHFAMVTCFPLKLRQSLLNHSHDFNSDSSYYHSSRHGTEGVNRAFLFDIDNFLAGDILVKIDRAAMAVGLEVRCPFLDPALVEFALSMPVQFKINRGQGKYIFRRAFQDLWPPSVRSRSKQGFRASEEEWLQRRDVRDLIEEVVLNKNNSLSRIFHILKIRGLTEGFYRKKKGFTAKQVWVLLSLGLWLDRWKRYISL